MGGAPRIGPASEGRHGVSLVPSEGPFREGMPHQHGRTLGKRTVAAVAIGGCGDRGVGHNRKWPLPPWTDRGERGQFPGRYGIGGVHPGGTQMEGMGPHGGRADQILGATVFGGRTSAGVYGQSTTNRDSGNPGRRMGLHRGRNLRR